ncbi:hypothetical protein Cgig2_001478 [Carnegiea gigantea]|uniref:Rho termination factor N-terminal domain-containing protein n=1 Tax=Carnegiea gigantea TaxID=171969 RepID=A0A9Q1KWE6_9CARY|nr:hypothetical protein Cgig2_001478 [Carnegiea gigantea]
MVRYDTVFVCMFAYILADIMDFDPRITSDGEKVAKVVNMDGVVTLALAMDTLAADIIAEDTETEKCCVKALQLLIAKADDEIRDLEDELAILQCQLKWAKYDEQRDPYEVSCAALRQKIDSLAFSIQSLSDGNLLSGHAMSETFEMQRPAERINDIINALISQKFSLTDEQMVLNGEDMLANLGSNIDMELIKQTAGFELSMESGEPATTIERQQPAHAISEESSSDAARYASKDPKEGRDVCKPDVEVTGSAQLDADRCTLGRSSGLLLVKPVMTPTHFQTCDEGHSMTDGLQPEETEECFTGSKIGESGLTFLSVKIEPLVKFEDDFDLSIPDQEVAIDSIPIIQDHEIEDLVEDHLKETENKSQSLVNNHITYNRRKFGSSSILKGQKVQRKTQSVLSGVDPSTPSLMPKPLRKIGKKESPSNAKGFGHLGMTSSNAERAFPFPESNWQRKLKINECIAYANTSGVVGTKRRQIQGASRDGPSIQCLEVKVSNTTGEVFGAKSLNGRQMLAKSPDVREVESSIVASDSTNANAVAMAEDPINDLENLRLRLEEDPCFLNKLKVSELKAIMKQNKMRGSYKLKKEKIVEELTKRLCL